MMNLPGTSTRVPGQLRTSTMALRDCCMSFMHAHLCAPVCCMYVVVGLVGGTNFEFSNFEFPNLNLVKPRLDLSIYGQ